MCIRDRSNPDATFNGVVGALIDGSFDFSPVAWGWVSYRDPWVDFSDSVFMRSYDIYFQSVSSGAVDLAMFVRPLTPGAWVLVLVCISVIGLGFYLQVIPLPSTHLLLIKNYIFPDSTLRGNAELGDNNQVKVALVIYLSG